jgi:hypothetical protein
MRSSGDSSPSAPIALSTAMEIALVGPLMSCFEESNSAPTAVMMMAVYRPYSTGKPTMLA